MGAGTIDDGRVVFVNDMDAHTSQVQTLWAISVVAVGEGEEAGK
jgi:hypothetical protein